MNPSPYDEKDLLAEIKTEHMLGEEGYVEKSVSVTTNTSLDIYE